MTPIDGVVRLEYLHKPESKNGEITPNFGDLLMVLEVSFSQPGSPFELLTLRKIPGVDSPIDEFRWDT